MLAELSMSVLNQPDTRPELVVIGGLADWMVLELRALYRVHDLGGVSNETERARLLAQAAGAGAASRQPGLCPAQHSMPCQLTAHSCL